MSNERLPLGAVRTDDGQVVVPSSRRADGSTRKPIRIRQGYVPQDEVPKYKTVAQRRREQEAKHAAEERTGGESARSAADTAVDDLPLAALSLKPKKESPQPSDRGARSSGQERREPPAREIATEAAAESAGDHQQLKKQLTKINKQLKEIAKLQDADTTSLTTQQEQKIARKQQLQQQRNEIIAELNGATVTKSNSATGPRPKVAISL
ncbi:hypothetical protein PHYBOEH_007453 [Phytophthora boehmeriae]|uniref:WIBG Mago-binding domain-containing protein n=1 Tax=Phytophthora boehmeriae TaxID=109152 RepID=A0A8T1X7B5_9STRA|nr:hypothetical protein PHYBOEH_007453 [Phytophthora boehmeriae]